MKQVSIIFLVMLVSMAFFSISAQADLRHASGKITYLRVHDLGTGWGPATDFLDAEVIIKLDTQPNNAFGFQLRNDINHQARQSMLDQLRIAFNNNWNVTVDYDIEFRKKHGRLINVWLSKTRELRLPIIKQSLGKALEPQPRGDPDPRLPKNPTKEAKEWHKMFSFKYADIYEIGAREVKVFDIELTKSSTLFIKILASGAELENISAQLFQEGRNKPLWSSKTIKLGEPIGLISDQIEITEDMLVAEKRWTVRLSNDTSQSITAEVLIGMADIEIHEK